MTRVRGKGDTVSINSRFMVERKISRWSVQCKWVVREESRINVQKLAVVDVFWDMESLCPVVLSVLFEEK